MRDILSDFLYWVADITSWLEQAVFGKWSDALYGWADDIRWGKEN